MDLLLRVRVRVCKSVRLFVCWFVGFQHLLVGLLVCWFVGLLVYWFVGLLVCWFVGLFVSWFIGLLVCLLVCLFFLLCSFVCNEGMTFCF
jgi:hypothetical protein